MSWACPRLLPAGHKHRDLGPPTMSSSTDSPTDSPVHILSRHLAVPEWVECRPAIRGWLPQTSAQCRDKRQQELHQDVS